MLGHRRSQPIKLCHSLSQTIHTEQYSSMQYHSLFVFWSKFYVSFAQMQCLFPITHLLIMCCLQTK
ncbi:hypothetical protein D3C76_827370 [compost metagenome]